MAGSRWSPHTLAALAICHAAPGNGDRSPGSDAVKSHSPERFSHGLVPYQNSALRLHAARIKNGRFLRGYCSPSRHRGIESVRYALDTSLPGNALIWRKKPKRALADAADPMDKRADTIRVAQGM